MGFINVKDIDIHRLNQLSEFLSKTDLKELKRFNAKTIDKQKQFHVKNLNDFIVKLKENRGNLND